MLTCSYFLTISWGVEVDKISSFIDENFVTLLSVKSELDEVTRIGRYLQHRAVLELQIFPIFHWKQKQNSFQKKSGLNCPWSHAGLNTKGLNISKWQLSLIKWCTVCRKAFFSAAWKSIHEHGFKTKGWKNRLNWREKFFRPLFVLGCQLNGAHSKTLIQDILIGNVSPAGIQRIINVIGTLAIRKS